MLVSPSRIKKNMILRGRTLNFETPQKNYGNMVFILTQSRERINDILNSQLFRPMQLLSVYSPRMYRPYNRSRVMVDQKTEYAKYIEDTNGKIRKGKTFLDAYSGQNIFYDLRNEYNDTAAIVKKSKSSPISYQAEMFKYLCNRINSAKADTDYPKSYIVLPMSEYISDLRQLSRIPTMNIEPIVLFMLKLFGKDKLQTIQLPKVDLYIFYNPKARAMVVVDPFEKDFDDIKDGTFQKILRLNNFNAIGAEHDDLIGDDVEDEKDTASIDMSDEDAIENTKEEIKKVVLSKVAKDLRAPKTLSLDAETNDERELALAIDKKIDKYLETDANSEKSFRDLVAEVESDSDVKMKAVKYVETKKSTAHKMEIHSKGLNKEIEALKPFESIADDDSKIIKPKDFGVKDASIDDRIKTSVLSSMDEEYVDKQYRTDIMNAISAFSNSEFMPLTVDSVEFTDSSTDRDKKELLSIKYRSSDNKLFQVNVDLPKVVEERHYYLNGNKQFVKKQLIRLPLIKTKDDTVEITTNFNKMTITRSSGKIFRRNAYLVKLLKSMTGNKAIKIVYGYNAEANAKFEKRNNFEYEELAGFITSIDTPKYHLVFNRENLEAEMLLLKIPDDYLDDTRTPLAIEKNASGDVGIIYIDNSTEKIIEYSLKDGKEYDIADTMFDFIYHGVINFSDDKMPSIGKSFVYSKARFIKEDYPTFAMIASQIGLRATMSKAKIKWRFSKKRTPYSKYEVEVKFKDGYLYYDDTAQSGLLMNALYLFHTDDYDFADFDMATPYRDFFMHEFGPALGQHVIATLRMNLGVMIDPINREVLKDLKMPTDIYSVMIEASNMLIGNYHVPISNMMGYRVSTTGELVARVLYNVLANAYIIYQRHRMNGNPKTLKVDRNAVIRTLLDSPGVTAKSTLNPVHEAEEIAQASAKGFRGVNLDSAYTLEMITYDESANGILSANATPFSGSVGITRSLVYNPKITSVRGYIPNTNGMKLDATGILAPTELLAAFTSAGADPSRQAMQVAQTGHTTPILHPSRQLLGSGMNKLLPYMISDDFCFHAKKDGIVEKIDTKNELAILRYDDGTKEAIDLGENLARNTNMAFWIEMNLDMKYKEGERFTKGDILAVNPSYFRGKGRDVEYCPGALAKIAIAAGDFSFEDATLISDSLSKKCAIKVNILKPISLGKNALIHNIVKVGDHVKSGDPLLEFTSSFDDPDVMEFIAKLSDAEVGKNSMDSMTHEIVKSPNTGLITKMEVIYNCPFEELSESMQKVVKEYQSRPASRREALKGIDNEINIQEIGQYNGLKNMKTEFPQEGGVIINVWVEYIDNMKMGDKLTYNTALKGVISRVLPDDEAPVSEYRDNEIIEGILTPTGILSRMTSDIYKLLFSTKVLVEVGKQIREIWNGERE